VSRSILACLKEAVHLMLGDFLPAPGSLRNWLRHSSKLFIFPKISVKDILRGTISLSQ